MIKLEKIEDTLFNPLGIFILYILASGLVIMAFRYIFPGQAVPLVHFSHSWRLIQGFLEYISLFPSLVLSSLVIPFGFKVQERDRNNPYSAKSFQSFKMSIITAIAASTLFGLIFSLALPLARNYEVNLLSQSRLYLLAKERAQGHAATGEWDDTAQFIAICEQIWPNSPDLSRLKIETEIRLEEESLARRSLPEIRTEEASPEPVNATEALAMAETALEEERYFDAHWLATLGGRLARSGSVEKATAARLAGRAWTGVNSLAPNSKESRLYNIYRLKRDAHEALTGEEWIRAYFIFLDLLTLSPDDPDIARYFALSEAGVKQVSFFIDEIEMALGRILSGAVFSFPLEQGRLVMKTSSLSTSTDSAYSIGNEIMAFDRDGRPLWSMEAPFAKILPLARDSGPSLAILFRALDRTDKTKRWEPVVSGSGQGVPGAAELVLPVSWDNFLLLSNARRGLSALSSPDLMRAAENLGSSGYLPQVFQAELLERFVRPLFLLPFSVFAIVLGWRFRAMKRPRYLAIPMLGILPLVFNGSVHFSTGWLNNLGIWAVISLGFKTAALFFGIGIVVLFVASLIILAAEHN
jgi:hypothetical protein